MKKAAVATVLLATFLSGCGLVGGGVKEEPPVAVKFKYIVPTVPEDMLSIPPQVPNIDPQLSTDRDAAQWLIDSEARAQAIELKLRRVNDYLKQKLQELQKKIAPEDLIIN